MHENSKAISRQERSYSNAMTDTHLARFSLQGKTAVVTGGHRGLGREISVAIAEAGGDIIVIDRGGAGNSDVPSKLKELGRVYHSFHADLKDPAAITSVVEQVMASVDHVDILVNNAGISIGNKLEDISLQDWDDVMAVNLRAPFLLAQSLARGPRGMLARGSGTIVNISSTAGKDALDEHGNYCSSKAGLNMLTKMMTVEWASRGIRANAIAPTVVMTDMGRKVWGPPEKGGPYLAKIPQGRFLEPEEVGGAVVFLCSNASSMINGAILPIDGGFGCM